MSLFLTRKIEEALQNATGQKNAEVAFRLAHSLDGGFGETWLIAVGSSLLIVESKGLEDPKTQVFPLSEITTMRMSEKDSHQVGHLEIKEHNSYEFSLGIMEEDPFLELLEYWNNNKNYAGDAGGLDATAPSPSDSPSSSPLPPPPDAPCNPAGTSLPSTLPPPPTTDGPPPPPTTQAPSPPPPPEAKPAPPQFTPQPTPSPIGVRQCCHCHVRLEETLYDDIYVDVCQICGSTFLDCQEIDKMLGVEGITAGLDTLPRICPNCQAPIDETSPECPVCETPIRSILCPNCQYPMRPVSLGGLIIDKCSHCLGIWFDQGELEKTRELYRKHMAANPQYLPKCIDCHRPIEDKHRAFWSENGWFCEECFWRQSSNTPSTIREDTKRLVHALSNLSLNKFLS